jgi:hypothetical protein
MNCGERGLTGAEADREPLDCFSGLPIALRLLVRAHDRPPDRGTVGIAVREELVRPLGRADRRVVAVLVDKQLGGAVDVEIWDHWSLDFIGPAVRELLSRLSDVELAASPVQTLERLD